MTRLTAAGREIRLFGEAALPCPLVFLLTFENEGEAVWDTCRTLAVPDMTLAAVQIDDWNDALSPWKADPIFRGESPFGGHADRLLAELAGEILPAVTAHLPAPPVSHAIAGYSLAGLFSLYALYRTAQFSRAASVSGSLWFPGFGEFARTQHMARQPDAVYLSLGDREHKTRNAVMASVLSETQAFYAHCRALSVPCIFEQNPGNHFREPAVRTAKGIAWLLHEPTQEEDL